MELKDMYLLLDMDGEYLHRTPILSQEEMKRRCRRKVDVEMLELEHVQVDGIYYRITGWFDGYAILEEVKVNA